MYYIAHWTHLYLPKISPYYLHCIPHRNLCMINLPTFSEKRIWIHFHVFTCICMCGYNGYGDPSKPSCELNYCIPRNSISLVTLAIA